MSKPNQYITTGAVTKIKLTQRQWAIIDTDDISLVQDYRWHAAWARSGNRFYVSTNIKLPTGKHTSCGLHRVLLRPEAGMLIDHINHDSLDNRRSNLRICNKAQNGWNSLNNVRNKSGATGVIWHKQSGKWMAYAKNNGKQQHLGLFLIIADAKAAYTQFVTGSRGKFAYMGPT